MPQPDPLVVGIGLEVSLGLPYYAPGNHLASRAAKVPRLAEVAALPATHKMPLALGELEPIIYKPAGQDLARHDASGAALSRMLVDLFVLARSNAVVVNLSHATVPMRAQLPMLAALSGIPVFGFNPPQMETGWTPLVCNLVAGRADMAELIRKLTM